MKTYYYTSQTHYEPYLAHHGVKGMKWGVRKEPDESYTVRTKNGEIMTLQRDTGGLFAKSLRRLSPKVRTEADKTYYYNLKNTNNKTVGNLQLYKKNSDEMNVTWGSVKKKYRGNGYMSAMIEQGEEISRLHGAKKITAEIVMNSPDMIHIVEKRGYIKKGQITTDEMIALWGGLQLVEKDL